MQLVLCIIDVLKGHSWGLLSCSQISLVPRLSPCSARTSRDLVVGVLLALTTKAVTSAMSCDVQALHGVAR